jgi:hypothetical protein
LAMPRFDRPPAFSSPITLAITHRPHERGDCCDGVPLLVHPDGGVVKAHLLGDVAGERTGHHAIHPRAPSQVDERAPEAVDRESVPNLGSAQAGQPRLV